MLIETMGELDRRWTKRRRDRQRWGGDARQDRVRFGHRHRREFQSRWRKHGSAHRASTLTKRTAATARSMVAAGIMRWRRCPMMAMNAKYDGCNRRRVHGPSVRPRRHAEGSGGGKLHDKHQPPKHGHRLKATRTRDMAQRKGHSRSLLVRSHPLNSGAGSASPSDEPRACGDPYGLTGVHPADGCWAAVGHPDPLARACARGYAVPCRPTGSRARAGVQNAKQLITVRRAN